MNIMLDLETMGTGPLSAIVAIGAVAFDNDGIHGDFYTAVDLNTSAKMGGVIDPDTVLFWMQQEEAARAELFKPGALPLWQALVGFADFYRDHQGKELWGNGSDFDNVILASAYRMDNIQQPWKFYHNRCYRTIKSVHPNVHFTRRGTLHNAVDDALSQAHHLLQIAAAVGIEL